MKIRAVDWVPVAVLAALCAAMARLFAWGRPRERPSGEVDVIGVRAKVARTMPERMRGLIGRPPPAPGEGMLILKCNAIHTLFMKYPIDATFLDSGNRVVKVVRGIRPWRLFVWGGWRAVKVLETACYEV